MDSGKDAVMAVIVSAPSGCGKSTLISRLMKEHPELGLHFSVSATSRQPREGEVNGREYHFMTEQEFKQRIDCDEFLEWEEVYPGRYYGTLLSEPERIAKGGGLCVLDIDVNGALRVKKKLGDKVLALFVAPPSLDELRRRLESRATDSAADIATRLERAGYEIGQAPLFDAVIINDDLERATAEIARLIKSKAGLQAP